MRIVIYATAFYPLIGGLEEAARICGMEFQRAGHDVTIITPTLLGDSVELPLRVCRRPGLLKAWHAIAGCDVFLEFNLSLKGLIMPWLARKPVVVSHQSWFSAIDRKPTRRARLKRLVCRLVTNIACSSAIKEYLGMQAEVVPNPYDNSVFRLMHDVPRDRDVLFVGRLVSDKGADLLVDAMAKLKEENLRPSLTITGSGPEAEPLREQVARLGLANQTVFTGPLRGAALAREMNRHRILVVPSLWPEPFGIVALEGASCGCWVLGSDQGGLKEAIGPCGMTFPNGDVDALTHVLRDRAAADGNSPLRQAHLDACSADSVSACYLKILGRAAGNVAPVERKD